MKNKSCFVVMPISTSTEKHTNTYWWNFYVELNKIMQTYGYDCIRSETCPGSIFQNIANYIQNSDIVVAVLTDKNPNVYYELGIRHALVESGTIMLIEQGQKIPFDISANGIIIYENDENYEPMWENLSGQIGLYLQKLGTNNFNCVDSPVHAALQAVPQKYPKKLYGAILWVDDYPAMHNRNLCKKIEELGISIHNASSTKEALKILGEKNFDLIVSDINREEADAGVTFLKLLKERKCRIPVVIYSGLNSILKYGIDCMKYGAVDVKTDPDELFSIICEYARL